MKKNMNAVDAVGREILVDDLIAYAVGAGRSQVLNFYKVVEIIGTDINDCFPLDHSYNKNVEIKAEYLQGHAWRYSEGKRKFARLYFPAERAVKLPMDYLPH